MPRAARDHPRHSAMLIIAFNTRCRAPFRKRLSKPRINSSVGHDSRGQDIAQIVKETISALNKSAAKRAGQEYDEKQRNRSRLMCSYLRAKMICPKWYER